MLPFERLVRAVDDWASVNPSEQVFIQIGNTDYEPRHAQFARMIPMAEYRQWLQQCDLFVAHVGTGSILQALEERKQTLMLPRRPEWGEHTTDHQIQTAKRFGRRPGIKVVDSVEDLQREISTLLKAPLTSGEAIPDHAPADLITRVRSFLDDARN